MPQVRFPETELDSVWKGSDMSVKSSIGWTQASWTPIRVQVKADAGEIAKAKGYTSLVQIASRMAGRIGPHCEKVSEGCAHCYSETNNGRCLPHNGTGLPFDRRARDLVDVFLDEAILMQPLHWRKPRKVFVCSQTDWMAEFVTDEMRDRMLAVMALCPEHTFQCLTKRAEEQERYFAFWDYWPLPNVWLGVSVENQKYADERIPHLLLTPAAVRFLSVEPMLGPVDITLMNLRNGKPKMIPGIDWVIVGGESGPDARVFDIGWARSIIRQCRDAGVACFVKQLGSKPVLDIGRPCLGGYQVPRRPIPYIRTKAGKGDNPAEWPLDLRVQEFPR